MIKENIKGPADLILTITQYIKAVGRLSQTTME